MSQKTNILAKAAAEVGYRAGNNNDNKFGRWFGMNNQPWCMIFISWCANQAQIPDSIIPEESFVPTAVTWFRNHGGIFISPNALPGDLIFFDNNFNGVPDHVGLVESHENGIITAIEGNTSNAVLRRSYQAGSGNIFGCARPQYQERLAIMPAIINLRVRDLDRGQDVQVRAVNLEGHNYVMLRDMGRLFPIVIGNVGAIPTLRMNYEDNAALGSADVGANTVQSTSFRS